MSSQGSFTCTPASGTVQVTALGACQYRLLLSGEVQNVFWTVSGQTISGNPITIGFPGNGTFPVSVTSNLFSCTGTVTATGCGGANCPCDFTATPSIDCSRLQITVSQPACSGGIHQWDFTDNGLDDWSVSPAGPTFTQAFFNVNTTTQSITIRHQIVNAQGQVISGPCSRTVTPANFLAAGVWGVFIGGSSVGGLNFCTDWYLDAPSGPQRTLLPGAIFDGLSTNPQSNVYVTGVLKVNRVFTFTHTTLFMGQSSRIDVTAPNGHSQTSSSLTFVDNTHARSNCKLL